MYIWTMQSMEVVQKLKTDGIYYPDFSLSPQIHRQGYDFLLNSYNRINGSSCLGLVFGILKTDAYGFTDFRDFNSFLKRNRRIFDALNCGSFSLFDNDHMALQLEYGDGIDWNLLPIDFWNFILALDEEESKSTILFDMIKINNNLYKDLTYQDFQYSQKYAISQGKRLASVYETESFLQVHLPYINLNQVRSIIRGKDF